MDRRTYSTHQNLLSQVTDSEDWEREVKRILGPLTEADLDAQERFKRAPFPIGATNHTHRHSAGTLVYMQRPACSRCESGLTRCVTPAACERADDPRPPPERGDLYRVLAMATWPLYAIALGAFFAWMLT